MSCNGCRILRKGCNDDCVLRQSLEGIESPKAQSNATLFLAKFFGRAGLISFLSSVPQSQRPALFQSLMFEACGRTVNPVSGAVGLLWRGNWHACQAAVETVLLGGILRASPECSGADENDLYVARDLNARLKVELGCEIRGEGRGGDLGLAAKMTTGGRLRRQGGKRRRPVLPSEESETTTLESGVVWTQEMERDEEIKLLRLFF